jgi:hypothetical protein
MAYAKLPLSFEANQGQTDPEVKFISHGAGYTLFLTPNEAVIALRTSAPSEAGRESASARVFYPSADRRTKAAGSDATHTALRLKLIGASHDPQAFGQEALPGKSNYFIGNDPKKWRTSIPNYAKVRYEGIYRGIDLVYYGNQRQLEYDFIVSPGSSPEAIRLSIEGAQKIALDDSGELVLETPGGELRLRKLLVYQTVDGLRRELSGSYILEGKDQVTFNIAAYDPTRPLIIDPVLSYSTYLGGSGDDEASAIAVDASGNAYIAGTTTSTNFPVTAGALLTTAGGGNNGFVAKLNPAGSALVYSTYLGGTGNDGALNIAVDVSGNAYVTGVTASTNFPTTVGAFQTTFGGGTNDAFVVKLNPTGSALVYSTYLGGNSDDSGLGIAVDASGDAYVAGVTASANFPTMGAFQIAFGGGTSDAIVAKLNPTGSALLYSTYLGGNGADMAFAIAVDASGDAFATGFTASTNFPTTPGAFQTASAGSNDVFVTKLGPTGSALVYSTYLGGSGADSGSGIAIDSSGNVYVTGSTNSTNFPVVNAVQSTYGGGLFDAFIAELNASGSSLVYSTYLGGSDDDEGSGIAVDSSGNAYVTGFTKSTNFPIVNPLQTSCGIGEDIFVAKLNPAGSGTSFLTCIGGSGNDSGSGIALDVSNSIYVTGETNSTNFPTVAPLQPTYGGGPFDAFVLKIGSLVGVLSVNPTSLDFGSVPTGQTAEKQVTVTNPATAATTFTGTAVNPSPPFSIPGGSVNLVLPPGQSMIIKVDFSPTAAGGFTDTLRIFPTGSSIPIASLPLTGTGIPAASITVSPTSIDFGNVVVGQTAKRSLTVSETANSTANFTGSIGNPAAPFSLEGGAQNFTLTPGQSKTFTVDFSPITPAIFTSNVPISASGSSTPIAIVPLSGAGIPAPSITVSPTSIDFGNVLVGQTTKTNVTVSEPASATTNFTGSIGNPTAPFSLEGGTQNFTLTPGQSKTFTVDFSPISAGIFTSNLPIFFNNSATPAVNVPLTGTGVTSSLPDYALTSVGTTVTSTFLGSRLPFSFTVKNQGTAAARGFIPVACFLEPNKQVGPSDKPFFKKYIRDPGMGASSSFSVTGTVPRNITPGAYFLGCDVNFGNKIKELDANNDTNNIAFDSTPIQICAKLSKTSLTTPANRAKDISTTPELDWSGVSGASSYEVQVATDSGFTTIVVSMTGLTVTHWTVTPALSRGTTYFWRVKAIDACGQGPWSATRTFTTAP